MAVTSSRPASDLSVSLCSRALTLSLEGFLRLHLVSLSLSYSYSLSLSLSRARSLSQHISGRITWRCCLEAKIQYLHLHIEDTRTTDSQPFSSTTYIVRGSSFFEAWRMLGFSDAHARMLGIHTLDIAPNP